MATNTFIAGPYTNIYNSISAGLTENGFEIRFRPELQLVNQSDIYGDTILDSIYRGGNCLMSFTCIEWGKTLANALIWPYAAAKAASPYLATQGFMGTVGKMTIGSTLHKTTLLTAVGAAGQPTGQMAGTTTATATPATFEALNSALAEGSDVAYMMTSRLRTVPVVLRLYPYTKTDPTGFAVGAYEVWFLTT